MIYKKLIRNNLDISFQLKKERLNESTNWFPFPIIISFFLVSLLGSQLLTSLNPRLGARVNPIRYYSEEKPNPMIWIGVYGDQNNINIVTSDRKKFTVKKTNYNLVGLKSFIEHLNEIKKRNYLAVARSSLEGLRRDQE